MHCGGNQAIRPTAINPKIQQSIYPFLARARSSKRTVRLISGIALDECLDPERYRTRVPIRTPEREVARAARHFQKMLVCEPVEETGQGFDCLSP